MEIAELAATDLVHPDPFPRGAEVHDLLRDVVQTPQWLARVIESVRGARRQIWNGLGGFRALARTQVEMGGRVVSVRLVHGAPKLRAPSSAGTGRDRAAARTTVVGLRYAR